MKYKYLVVDDEPLARKLIVSHASKIEGLELAGECGSAIEAGNFLQKHSVDLIFLDIQMPEMNGMQLISALKLPAAIILTTAYRDFAPEAFNLDVVDYLLKPIAFERLLKGVHKFFNSRQSTPILKPDELDPFIYLKVDRKLVKVSVGEIYYIESLDDYVKVHSLNKIHIVRENISSLEQKLSTHKFVRIHRSFLISTRFVGSISGDGVEVASNLLPFGRAYKQGALSLLGLKSKTAKNEG